MTTFKSAIMICGLTQIQAAEYLGISLGTVKSFGQGKGRVPEGVWEMLSDLYTRAKDAAEISANSMSLNDIEPREWGNIKADITDNTLPTGSPNVAAAMALLMAVHGRKL